MVANGRSRIFTLPTQLIFWAVVCTFKNQNAPSLASGTLDLSLKFAVRTGISHRRISSPYGHRRNKRSKSYKHGWTRFADAAALKGALVLYSCLGHLICACYLQPQPAYQQTCRRTTFTLRARGGTNSRSHTNVDGLVWHTPPAARVQL